MLSVWFTQKAKQFLSGNVESYIIKKVLKIRLWLFILCTWAVVCSSQPNRCYTCKKKKMLIILHTTGRERENVLITWFNVLKDSGRVSLVFMSWFYLQMIWKFVHILTNKKRPRTKARGSLQVEQVETVLLYCHVSHLNSKNMNLIYTEKLFYLTIIPQPQGASSPQSQEICVQTDP